MPVRTIYQDFPKLASSSTTPKGRRLKEELRRMAFPDRPRFMNAPRRYIDWYIEFLKTHPRLAREYYPSEDDTQIVDTLQHNEHIDMDHPPALRTHHAGLG